MSDTSCRVTGFPPLADWNSRILVLGTMPGVRSLTDQQYYAHPRNAFWPILFAVCGEEFRTDYPARLELLRRKGIALWDVCYSCDRSGSLDSRIRQEVPNDISGLLKQYPAIRTIVFNGNTSAGLYKKYFSQLPQYDYFQMPHTSPAYASLTFEQKKEKWLLIRPRLVDSPI